VFFLSSLSISLGELDVNLCVHVVKVLLEQFLNTLSLHLESRSDTSIFNGENLIRDEDFSGLLDVVKALFFADSANLGNNGLLKVGVLREGSNIFGFIVLHGPGLSTFIKSNNHYGVTLKGISVDETRSNQVTDSEGTFKLLRSNIFTLRKLHDHLGTIDDGNSSILVCLTNITRVEPTLIIEGFLGDFGKLVVPREDVRAFNLNLSTGVRLVSCEVVHVRNVLQSNLGASNRSSNMA
jgi:hypothetical protein